LSRHRISVSYRARLIEICALNANKQPQQLRLPWLSQSAAEGSEGLVGDDLAGFV
jgi:hypothetical protein